jgi:hypothetical protein
MTFISRYFFSFFLRLCFYLLSTKFNKTKTFFLLVRLRFAYTIQIEEVYSVNSNSN